MPFEVCFTPKGRDRSCAQGVVERHREAARIDVGRPVREILNRLRRSGGERVDERVVVEVTRDPGEVRVVQQGLDAVEQGRLSPLHGRADGFGDGAGREADGKKRKNEPDRDVDDHC